jgi:hypothetical protein
MYAASHSDDDSSSASDSSEEANKARGRAEESSGILGEFLKKNKNKVDVTQFDAFSAGDEGTVVRQMQLIMSIRNSLKMDDDKSFIRRENNKELERAPTRTDMDVEDRIKFEDEKTKNYMGKIMERQSQRRDTEKQDAQNKGKNEARQKEEETLELEAKQADALEKARIEAELASRDAWLFAFTASLFPPPKEHRKSGMKKHSEHHPKTKEKSSRNIRPSKDTSKDTDSHDGGKSENKKKSRSQSPPIVKSGEQKSSKKDRRSSNRSLDSRDGGKRGKKKKSKSLSPPPPPAAPAKIDRSSNRSLDSQDGGKREKKKKSTSQSPPPPAKSGDQKTPKKDRSSRDIESSEKKERKTRPKDNGVVEKKELQRSKSDEKIVASKTAGDKKKEKKHHHHKTKK